MDYQNHVTCLFVSCLLVLSLSWQCEMACGNRLTDSGLYGAALQGDALGNVPLAPKSYGGRVVSFRFRAPNSGRVTSLSYYNQYSLQGGYGKGNGGQIVIELRTDDGTDRHWPSKTVLASCALAKPLTAGYFPVLYFDNKAFLEAGKLYHIVFSNVHSNPAANFVSINCLHNYRNRLAEKAGDSITGPDMAVLVKNDIGDIWLQRIQSTPIFNLFFSDGKALGQGYVGAISGWNVTMDPVSKVRETFVVKGSEKAVTEVFVRVSRNSGDLTVRLEGRDGALIEEGVIPGVEVVPDSELFLKNRSIAYVGKMRWYSYRFKKTHLLEPGKGYNLVVSSPNGSYLTWGLLKGQRYTFSPATHFADGWCQYSTNNGKEWQDYLYGQGSHTKDVDLQFYFVLTGRQNGTVGRKISEKAQP
jgi:hypothetical protein